MILVSEVLLVIHSYQAFPPFCLPRQLTFLRLLSYAATRNFVAPSVHWSGCGCHCTVASHRNRQSAPSTYTYLPRCPLLIRFWT